MHALNQYILPDILIMRVKQFTGIIGHAGWTLKAPEINQLQKISIIKAASAAVKFGGFSCGSRAWVCSCIAAQAGDPYPETA
jgi:hypothetical protein